MTACSTCSCSAATAQVILASRSGRAVRFPEVGVRQMGRTAAGVRGIALNEEEADDKVVGMVCIAEGSAEELLVVSDNGYGKRSALDGEGGYRITNRGGKGVKAMQITDKTGKLVSIQAVTDADDLMIINRSGLTIRLSMSELRTIGRATQGVRLFKVAANDEISSVAKVAAAEVELDTLAAEALADEVLVGETDGQRQLAGTASAELNGEAPDLAADTDDTDEVAEADEETDEPQ